MELWYVPSALIGLITFMLIAIFKLEAKQKHKN